MTNKNKKNKKYTPAVRRELRRIVRQKVWRGFLAAGVMVLLLVIAALGLLTIANYNQRSEFDGNVRNVCNGMYRVIKDGESDQEIREDIESILSKCNTPYFVSKVYRYDNGVKLSGQDARFEDDAATVDDAEFEEDDTFGSDTELGEDDTFGSDVEPGEDAAFMDNTEYGEDTAYEGDAELEEDAAVEDDTRLGDEENSSDTGSGDDDFQPGDTFVEDGITYEWISTDEGITAVRVHSEEYTYEDTRSASEIYHDFVAQGKDDVDFVNMDAQYERSRAYLNDVFEREGMDSNTDYEENISWRGYYYRGRTVTVGGNDYYVAAAMYENPFSRPEMKLLHIIMYMTLLVLMCYVIIAVISYRKKKREVIEDETRRNIIAAIAHDVRGPVTAISGYAENLQQIAHDAESRHYTASILDNVSYINEMITGMLSYIRLENTLTIKNDNVDMAELARQVTDRYAVELENRNIECEIAGHAEIRADARLMDIMLDNLIMNTAKYAPDNSVVSVAIDGRKLVISNDMDGEIDCDPSELWEPMKKGNSARTGHTGNGLGLSIVKKIFDLSGFTGDIVVEDGKFVVTVIWG